MRAKLASYGRVLLVVVPTLLVAAGCAGKPAPQLIPEPNPFTETGLASWYGKKFHGRQTASGERFDMHSLTAAHRTLPFGTWVRVTNMENRRSVKVRINDRGPFRKGRVIDVSYAAARELRMVTGGVVRVRVAEIGVPSDAILSARKRSRR